ncbi:MAG: GAF domain-containing protein [Candidatus Dadabacteria bacterium]|nr:GAF domain-containing protein [Candidatus Dadabacteria bacterium]NIS10310.1 GAF domain-containing protein [Candidatus Dadabacteria bacterium]NIV42968.1 GAF domain-containing protein [Candidatus Dadabacteria bacterium]NIY23230.1 GAF domain-containing protein [Candidatus Dadabacteria bacterium]
MSVLSNQRHNEVLNSLSRLVTRTRDLQEIYKTSADFLNEMEHVDMVMIYVVDEDTNQAVLEAHRNVSQDYLARASRVNRPKGITWRVISSNQFLNVKDAQTDEAIGPAGKALGKHGVLGMPITLTSGGEARGVIWLWSDTERAFTDEEVKLLSAIGNQIATAIAWAKQYEDRRKVWQEKFKV